MLLDFLIYLERKILIYITLITILIMIYIKILAMTKNLTN